MGIYNMVMILEGEAPNHRKEWSFGTQYLQGIWLLLRRCGRLGQGASCFP